MKSLDEMAKAFKDFATGLRKLQVSIQHRKENTSHGNHRKNTLKQ
jgi:hypothetical protein